MTGSGVVHERRTEKLDVRVSRSAKAKRQAAAAASQRSMSDFVMESALPKAEETLLERRTFGLTAEAVHAKDDAARRYYEQFDFVPSPADPFHLFVLLKDIRRHLEISSL